MPKIKCFSPVENQGDVSTHNQADAIEVVYKKSRREQEALLEIQNLMGIKSVDSIIQNSDSNNNNVSYEAGAGEDDFPQAVPRLPITPEMKQFFKIISDQLVNKKELDAEQIQQLTHYGQSLDFILKEDEENIPDSDQVIIINYQSLLQIQTIISTIAPYLQNNPKYQSVASVWEELHLQLGMCWRKLGDNYTRKRKWDMAVDAYKKGITIFSNHVVRDNADKNLYELAKFHYKYANCLKIMTIETSAKGDAKSVALKSEAIENYDQAIKTLAEMGRVYDVALELSDDCLRKTADIYRNFAANEKITGDFYTDTEQKLQQFKNSVAHYKLAINILNKVGTPSQNDADLIQFFNTKIINILIASADWEESLTQELIELDKWQKAKRIAQRGVQNLETVLELYENMSNDYKEANKWDWDRCQSTLIAIKLHLAVISEVFFERSVAFTYLSQAVNSDAFRYNYSLLAKCYAKLASINQSQPVEYHLFVYAAAMFSNNYIKDVSDLGKALGFGTHNDSKFVDRVFLDVLKNTPYDSTTVKQALLLISQLEKGYNDKKLSTQVLDHLLDYFPVLKHNEEMLQKELKRQQYSSPLRPIHPNSPSKRKSVMFWSHPSVPSPNKESLWAQIPIRPPVKSFRLFSLSENKENEQLPGAELIADNEEIVPTRLVNSKEVAESPKEAILSPVL